MDDFSYSRSLIASIMRQLPRFIHKHTIVYRMYTTLKLYYLHQQELLAEILNILKLHMHSADLAKTIQAYISKMHAGNYGWVKQISTLVSSNMKMHTNVIHSIVAHHRFVYQLHSIIRHAASHSHAMIHRLYSVMKKEGFSKHSHTVHSMVKLIKKAAKTKKAVSKKALKKLAKKIKKIAKKVKKAAPSKKAIKKAKKAIKKVKKQI